MDLLTFIVMKRAQPRAKVVDRSYKDRMLCIAHVVESNAQWHELVDKPGPQGHCMVCGKALRRPRLNSV